MREMVKNNITEMVFIIDRSGSMTGLEADTVGGFNSMIEKQKKLPGKAYVSTVLFNHENTVVYDRVPLENIEPMKLSDYEPLGTTALLDAIGEAVYHIKNIHKYARKEDVPEHTVFVITTDGMENASRRFDSKTIKKLIKQYEEEYGWEFLFIGANIDAVETASDLGIRQERAANYNATAKGTKMLYEVVSDTMSCLRFDSPVEAGWADKLKED